MKVPKQEQPPGRKSIPVEVDEISTLPDGYEVMVLPSGIVKVRGKKQDGTVGWLSDKELEELGDLEPLNDKDEEVEDEVDGQFASDTEEYDRPDPDRLGKEDFSSGSEDDESVVKAAEEAYLKELSAEMVSKVNYTYFSFVIEYQSSNYAVDVLGIFFCSYSPSHESRNITLISLHVFGHFFCLSF